MWNDADLQIHVDKELAWDPTLHSRQIGVTVKDAVAHLAGHVDSYRERCAAESAAWRVAHVRAVVNELRVELPFDAQREDDDLALAAMTILEWNCLVPESVQVQVTTGILTLTGDVPWRHQREEAERAVSPLNGLKGLVNQIRIQPARPLGDVKSPIEDALKRNSLVNSSHIRVQLHHGIVSLLGTAHSRAERDEALRAAWSAPGVATVEDHITVG
jgi:osmotically-inducible protein OsmY